MIALIDGDILTYRCGFAAQHTDYYVRDKDGKLVGQFDYKRDMNDFLDEAGDDSLVAYAEVNEEPVSHALQNVNMTMQYLLENVKATDHRTFITGKGNFREKIATIKPYKGNRDPDHKPVHYEAIRQHILDKWNGELVDGMEADDAMGIDQTDLMRAGKESIICSVDKDMDMIPGWHYNWVKQAKYYMSEEAALRKFYMQLLTGDVTDNVQGAKGIGPARAAKLLKDAKSELDMYRVCKEAYKNDLVALNENAQLLWIFRDEWGAWAPPE